jgi:Flp pilus assembly protein TadG
MSRQLIFGFARDQRGVSAVEFALVVPVLLISLLGVTDIGNAVYKRADMESALRAGVQYFMNGGDELAKAEDVVNESWTTKPDGVTILAERFCLCDAVEHACNVLCDDDTYPASYNRIRATATFPGVLMENSYEAEQSVRVR